MLPLHTRVCHFTSLLNVQHMTTRPVQARSCSKTTSCRLLAGRHAALAGNRPLQPRPQWQREQRGRQWQRQHVQRCCASGHDASKLALSEMDANQLQTALQIAVDSEDFEHAGAIRQMFH